MHTLYTHICSHTSIQEPVIPLEGFTPSPLTYLMFAIVSVLLLVALLLLSCLRHLQNLINTAHKNLVFVLLITTVVFAVGINRTEVGGVCSAFGIVLFYLIMACLSWMVASSVIIARFLLDSPPREKFAITLYIIGWGKALLATAR